MRPLCIMTAVTPPRRRAETRIAFLLAGEVNLVQPLFEQSLAGILDAGPGYGSANIHNSQRTALSFFVLD